ncbi:hypothetical protein H9N28_11120 [Rhodobacter capsulatus]|uniref:Uncharacterized protein n=1 Tax=Rhodobacter capsulatus TaxID=1061 RepID=A0A1G7RBJ4_RHOCA|nr:hypothetical protein [Rhodobacter capsulatus]PZX22099.1 hypothetical protein LY44_03096 [Rhodobacter capsulatus]QNR62136.1 hypothetical protein H9N28_11120 [Rhodobacter capsulatus]WER08126.1 hypothetical protein PUH89_12420 [Rhodobacter capsulatus]SDG08112.1 hypothetical protein SAMN04244550_03383 [Rhodobacter capsulatus]
MSSQPKAAPLMPSTTQILRAGVNGAAITGAWTAINEGIRVRNGQTTTDAALRATANSAAIGAGAGAVATLASHLARNAPALGLVALAAGVIYFARSSRKAAPETAPDAGSEEAEAAQ